MIYFLLYVLENPGALTPIRHTNLALNIAGLKGPISPDFPTNKENEDFGNHFKRIIPTNPKSIVKKGIENLFPNEVINKGIAEKKAFVDFKKIIGTKRGVNYTEEQYEINKDEKTNFCDWTCANGTVDDFKNFKVIFEIIEGLI